MSKIIIIEDDRELSKSVRDWLTAQHHTVDTVADGDSGWEHLRFYNYDLVICDWNLPGKSGLEICKEFRRSGGKTPFLMLTGKDAIVDKETGLDAGADDYLTKPFDTRELSARVRALLRRPAGFVAEQIVVGDLVIDNNSHTVTRSGCEIHLFPLEYALLELLAKHPGQVFSPEAILDRVWASNSDASIDTVRTYIKTLRKKLDNNSNTSIIKTVQGAGYKLQA